MSNDEYPVVVEALVDKEGGGYLALAPDLPGCVADGETQEAALKDLRSAVAEWIDEAKRLGRKIPEPGSYAERAQKEREHLRRLVDAQDELIQRQGERLKEVRDEIAKIKASLGELVDDDDRCERSYAGWALVPASVVSASPRRNQRLRH